MKDEIYFWPQKSLVWILTAVLLIKLFFPLFFPQTSIYAKGNNIEITQEELEEYTEDIRLWNTARMQKISE